MNYNDQLNAYTLLKRQAQYTLEYMNNKDVPLFEQIKTEEPAGSLHLTQYQIVFLSNDLPLEYTSIVRTAAFELNHILLGQFYFFVRHAYLRFLA